MDLIWPWRTKYASNANFWSWEYGERNTKRLISMLTENAKKWDFKSETEVQCMSRQTLKELEASS